MKTEQEIKKEFYEVNYVAKYEQMASMEFQNAFLDKQKLDDLDMGDAQRQAIIKNNKKQIECLKREIKFLKENYLGVS